MKKLVIFCFFSFFSFSFISAQALEELNYFKNMKKMDSLSFVHVLKRVEGLPELQRRNAIKTALRAVDPGEFLIKVFVSDEAGHYTKSRVGVYSYSDVGVVERGSLAREPLGGAEFFVPKDKQYLLVVQKENYEPSIATISTVCLNKALCLTDITNQFLITQSWLSHGGTAGEIRLETQLKPIRIKEVVVDSIYFAFDRAELKKESFKFLNSLASWLSVNSWASIEIGAHTDSRGSDSYNLSLSERRAASVVSYLVSKGIDPSRLTSKGYGETQLLEPDPMGSVEGVQKNRRVAMKIVGINKTQEPTLEEVVANLQKTLGPLFPGSCQD